MNAAEEPDPRGLIREAFRMPGITEADCRSIFFDWALGLADATAAPAAIAVLLERHADAPEEHPMRKVLKEGLRPAGAEAGRRTGRRRAPRPQES